MVLTKVVTSGSLLEGVVGILKCVLMAIEVEVDLVIKELRHIVGGDVGIV